MVVVPPHPGGLSSAGWAEQWILNLSGSLQEAPPRDRPGVAARLAALLLASSRDEEADGVLMTARREAVRAGDVTGLACIELALAAAACTRDDDANADARLAEARASLPSLPPSLEARAWIIAARRARIMGAPDPGPPRLTAEGSGFLEGRGESLDPDEQADLAAELALEGVVVARRRSDFAAARAALVVARESVDLSGSMRWLATFDLEAGDLAAAMGDATEARARFRAAIDGFHDAGLWREEGRAMIRFAATQAMAGAGDQVEAAASWLGRAQHVLGSGATWRDRLALRSGFRAFGRRGLDRVMAQNTSARVEAFERARGALVNALTQIAPEADRALTAIEPSMRLPADATTAARRLDEVRRTTHEQAARALHSVRNLDASTRDLIELIGVALFERDRLRGLLKVLAEIDKVTAEAPLPSIVAALAGPLLDADRVVVALRRSGVLEADGQWGSAVPGTEDDWRTFVPTTTGPVPEAGASRDVEPRSEEPLLGPRLAVAIRGGETQGLLYADRARRGGQFREPDEALAHLLAEYVAVACGRLRAREEQSVALHQLAVTLGSIRDGVVACDGRGIISSFNSAAARMLRVGHEQLRGARFAALPSLAPLWSLLEANPRLDGTVVRLDHASFVVTARPVSATEPKERGFVVTLVELDRAQKIAQRLSATRARYRFTDFIGDSAILAPAVAMARRASMIDANVLLNGESGTGKEVLAQAIHTGGPRAEEPFIGVNCAAVPRELLEAELFGYEKGAFTGARAGGNPGKFEMAAGGTILLDEIGDMPLEMQAKLLRVLQERVVTRLGGHSEVHVDARVIATTHRDLAQLVEEGAFRMDLYYRLRVLALEIPPLRERPEDIASLAQHFLTRFAEQQRKRVCAFSRPVEDELERYEWPGNVRELANVVEAEVSLAPADADVIERLATRLVGRFRTAATAGSTGSWAALPASGRAPDEPILSLEEVEKRAILSAVERLGGSVSKAADALGVSKVTLYARLRAWGMHPRDRGDDAGEGPESLRPPGFPNARAGRRKE